MAPEPSRRRFIAGCCAAGAGALAMGGLTGGAAADSGDAQSVPETRWDRTYEHGTAAEANALVPTDDGFVVVGTAEPSDGGSASEAWLYEVNGAGELRWEETFAARDVTEGRDVAVADDGFIVAGITRESGSDEQSAVALRVDADGAEQWRKVFDTEPGNTDTMQSVDVDSEGRFVFAGWTSRFDDAWTARLNDSGEIEWAERYGPGTHNRFHGVVAASSGGYVVVGETDDTSGDTAGWAVKLAEDGSQQFSQQFKKESDSSTNPYDDFNVLYDVAETRNGYVAVGANAFDPDTNDQRGWALEFNVNGGELWDRRLTEDSYTALRSVRSGELQYFVAGETATNGDGRDARGYVANLGIKGEPRWTATYGDGSSEFSALARTDGDGLVCVGSRADGAGADGDGWGVKIGGEEAATATPSPTPSPTPTPTSGEPTPTFTATPTDAEAGAGDGGADGTDAPAATPTGTPTSAGPMTTGGPTTTGGDGSDGGAGDGATTPAEGDGSGISPTTIGIGAVILALGGGGLLYNRFVADGDEGVGGPDAGAGDPPADAGSGGAGAGGGAPPAEGAGGGDGGVETTEPHPDANEDVQRAQTVVENPSDGPGGAADGTDDAADVGDADGSDDPADVGGADAADGGAADADGADSDDAVSSDDDPDGPSESDADTDGDSGSDSDTDGDSGSDSDTDGESKSGTGAGGQT